MISFSRISKQYGRQVLFVDASFQFNPGKKVGLVGPNGAGKTTLFRMIVGEETPDDGEVSLPTPKPPEASANTKARSARLSPSKLSSGSRNTLNA